MLLLLLAACTSNDEAPGNTEPPEALGPQLAFDTEALDFGAVRVGRESTLSVAIHNVGDATLLLEAPRLEDPERPYVIGEIPTLEVAPGGTVEVDVTFAASVRGTPSTRLLVPSNDADDPVSGLILVALASSPVATLDPPSLDFGVREEACVDARAVAVRNDGEEPLVVTAVGIEGGQDAFVLDVAEAEQGPLPWTLGPGEAREVWVTFAPDGDATYAGGLVVSSDDPANARAAAALDGVGYANARITDNFVTLGKHLDVIFALSGTDADGLAAELAAAIPTFTAPLLAANVPFDIGAIRADDGCLENGLLVDGTMTEEEQTSAFAGLLDTSGTEHTLTLLERAVALTTAEACNEELVRARANLVLVGVSDTAAPAPQAHGVYTAAFEATKSDAEDVAAWAILPDGGDCGEADVAWTEVTVATGGAYLSLCDDLATSLATIAEASVERQDSFLLSTLPWPDTLVVSVDGEYTSAFVYDAVANEVTFDAGAEPLMGSPVRVFYDAMPVCEGL